MLFGEYSVICQGKALTIPLQQFKASFKYPGRRFDKEEASLNQELKDYLLALVRNEENDGLNYGIDLNAFALDLLRGMYLDSNIPRGYGVGSSGALVAAVYSEYAQKPIMIDPMPGYRRLIRLQKDLALLESHFHGTSSGLDPLSCYVGKPLMITPGENVRTLKISRTTTHETGGFFLADTGLKRKTDSLVKGFLKDYQQPAFRNMIHDMYIPVVDFCMEAFCYGNPDELIRGFRHLSSLQMHHFRPMIPRGMEDIWEIGLETGEFYLKLCGAGGGGYLLGYTENYAITKKIFKKAGIPLLTVHLPA